MGATNSFIGANFILGQANLVNPPYEIQRWHTVLVAYAITWIATFINMWGSTILDKVPKLALFVNIVSFIVTVVTILACNKNKQSALFVFKISRTLLGLAPLWLRSLGFCNQHSECVAVSVDSEV